VISDSYENDADFSFSSSYGARHATLYLELSDSRDVVRFRCCPLLLSEMQTFTYISVMWKYGHADFCSNFCMCWLFSYMFPINYSNPLNHVTCCV